MELSRAAVRDAAANAKADGIRKQSRHVPAHVECVARLDRRDSGDWAG